MDKDDEDDEGDKDTSVLTNDLSILSTGRECTDDDGTIVSEDPEVVIVFKSIKLKAWWLMISINYDDIKKHKWAVKNGQLLRFKKIIAHQ